jgi:hypothetical protein
MSEENTPPSDLSSGSQNLSSVPAVKPLTRGNYKRLPEVELLIQEVSVLENGSLLTRARERDVTLPGFLPPEVLVYFIRCAYKAGDKRLGDNLFYELLERCTQRLIGDMQGFPPSVQTNMRQEVLGEVIEDLLNPDDRGDFAQVRFWKYFKFKSISVYRRYKRQYQKEPHFESLDTGWDSNQDNQGASKLDRLQDHRLSPEDHVFLENALESLPSDLRELFLLAHYLKIQIESNNPNELTLSKHYGVTGRTIRTRLKKAKEYLARYLENAHDD